MPRTLEEQEAWERQAMGCTAAELKAVNFTWKLPGVGNMMMAMSILSDVQEVAEMTKADERIRQFVNRAKMFLVEEMEARRTP